jgi:hypothetical protein
LLEVARSRIEAAAVEQILVSAIARDYPIVPLVTVAGMDALRPWLKSQNFQFVSLETDSSNMPVDSKDVSNKIVSYFEHQIGVGWRCNVDGMNSAQLEAVSSTRQLVRQKYPSFMTWLVSSRHGGTDEPDSFAVNGTRVPYISTENEGVLKTLFRFITSPRRINYNPFFQPEAARLEFNVATNQLNYASPGGDRAVEGFEAVRQSIKLESRKQSSHGLLSGEKVSQCLSCKFSLVCGRNWVEERGYKNAGECAGLFERRIRQVLPLLIYNIRGNLRAPASLGKKN